MFARGGTQGGEGFTGDKASEGPYGSPAWYIENVMEELDMVSRTSMHVMFAASALRCAAAMMVAIYMYVCVLDATLAPPYICATLCATNFACTRA